MSQYLPLLPIGCAESAEQSPIKANWSHQGWTPHAKQRAIVGHRHSAMAQWRLTADSQLSALCFNALRAVFVDVAALCLRCWTVFLQDSLNTFHKGVFSSVWLLVSHYNNLRLDISYLLQNPGCACTRGRIVGQWVRKASPCALRHCHYVFIPLTAASCRLEAFSFFCTRKSITKFLISLNRKWLKGKKSILESIGDYGLYN